MRHDTNRHADPFFSQQACDRCGGKLIARIMSWFTKETLCLVCADKEAEIKVALRANHVKNAMEGCGFVPQQGKDY
jgi:hypothetical protein